MTSPERRRGGGRKKGKRKKRKKKEERGKKRDPLGRVVTGRYRYFHRSSFRFPSSFHSGASMKRNKRKEKGGGKGKKKRTTLLLSLLLREGGVTGHTEGEGKKKGGAKERTPDYFSPSLPRTIHKKEIGRFLSKRKRKKGGKRKKKKKKREKGREGERGGSTRMSLLDFGILVGY